MDQLLDDMLSELFIELATETLDEGWVEHNGEHFTADDVEGFYEVVARLEKYKKWLEEERQRIAEGRPIIPPETEEEKEKEAFLVGEREYLEITQILKEQEKTDEEFARSLQEQFDREEAAIASKQKSKTKKRGGTQSRKKSPTRKNKAKYYEEGNNQTQAPVTHDPMEFERETPPPESPSSRAQPPEALDKQDDDDSITIQQMMDIFRAKRKRAASELNQPSSSAPNEVPYGIEGLNEDESLYDDSYYFSDDEEERKRREEAKKRKLEQEQTDEAYARKLQDQIDREARAAKRSKGVGPSQQVEHLQIQHRSSRGRGRPGGAEGRKEGGANRGRNSNERGRGTNAEGRRGRRGRGRDPHDDNPMPRRGRGGRFSRSMRYWLGMEP